MTCQLAPESKFMKGRQILAEVHNHFRIPGTEGIILDFCDITHVTLHKDHLVTFLNG